MRDQFRKSNRKTLPSSGSVTSSPALEGGPSPCEWPSGPTTAPSGPAPAPASRFRLPAGVREPPITGTYGPTFSDSSMPEVLASSWVSRLRERLATSGSLEWDLIWRRRAIGGKRWIYRLAPLGRRTSATGCIGWPTPAERDYRYPNRLPYQDRGGGSKGEQLPNLVALMEGWYTPCSTDGEKGGPGMTFGAGGTPLPAQAAQAAQAALCGWATPRACTAMGVEITDKLIEKVATRFPNLETQAARASLVGWTTPQTHDSSPGDPAWHKRHGTRHGDANLNDEVAGVELAGWKTPLVPSGGRVNPAGTSLTGRRPDGKKVTVDLREEVRGTIGSSPGQTHKGSYGALNPEFVCWLQGFPVAWLNYVPSGTRLSRRLRRKS